MSKKHKILLAEDDPNLGTLLNDYLNAKGFECTLTTDGQSALKKFSINHYDFVILDVMMPIKDGFTTAKEMRDQNKIVPILFLTAKSMKEDKMQGFEVGADDYLTKPFNMEELVARVNAILRRTQAIPDDSSMIGEIEIGKFKFDYNKQRLNLNGEETKLTTKETELLYLLTKYRNSVMERNYALNAIWGDDNYFNGRSMDVYIAKLRKYLKGDESVEIINVHGKGFKLLQNATA